MDYRVLNLSISQLSKCIERTSINKYSDKRKESYYKTLNQLFDKITGENFEGLTTPELLDKKRVVDFIFSSIQYLDNSTLSTIPFEIVYCLEQALNEWIPGHPYIVVTSLSNDLESYSFNPNLALNEPIFQLISNQYGINFNYRLIQITLPRYFAYDYLTNVVLYHELGHFIDLKYKISETVVNNNVISGLIPHPTVNRARYESEKFHYGECFADLFAAQYISNTSTHYVLNYLAHNYKANFTHPATEDRIKLVDIFIREEKNPFIEQLSKESHLRAGQSLTKKYINFPLSDFFNLIPPIISNVIELHSILISGWEFWLKPDNPIVKKFGENTAYKYVNSIIEKAISNYIITSTWNRQNVSN